ncbi:alpha/beta hydrolase family protein [Patescibacteria group bacterium]
MKKLFIVFIAVILFPLVSSAYEAGVKTFTWDNGEREIPVMVWYPAITPMVMPGDTHGFDYYGFIQGDAKYNAVAEVEFAPYPVIIFSHGLGMCSFQSVFIMEHLARNGYVVIAPDHKDSAICHIGGQSDVAYKQLFKAMILGQGDLDKTVRLLFPEKINHIKDPGYRPEETSFVISQILVEPELTFLADYHNIAGLGHSFGGWTMLALAGGNISCGDTMNYPPSFCNQPDLPVTTAQVQKKLCCCAPYRGVTTSYYDPRLKAIAILAPGSFIFPHYSDLDIQVPVMFITGDHFEVDYWTNIQLPYNLITTPKYLVEFSGADHMTPSDIMAEYFGAKVALRGYWFYPCKQKKYKNYTLAFYNKYLRQDSAALDQLLNSCDPWTKIQHQE